MINGRVDLSQTSLKDTSSAVIIVAIRLRYDYDLTTAYRARLLPFDSIRREQKMNVSIFRSSRVVVVLQSNRNCDIGLTQSKGRKSTYTWPLPVEHKSQTTCLQTAMSCTVLRLPTSIVFITCFTHFFVKMSSPGVQVTHFLCGLAVSAEAFIHPVISSHCVSSQFHFILLSWSHTSS